MTTLEVGQFLWVFTNESSKKLTYTSVEAGQLLGLSTRTIARLCREGRLPRVQGIRHILIPATQLEQWVEDNTVYTRACEQESVGENSWIVANRKKVSTSTKQSGGHLTQMEAVKELEELLAVK